MILIKLGGSVITDKAKRKTFRSAVTRRLAREVADAGRKVVLVHGAGSYGHPLAAAYGLDRGHTAEEQLEGFSAVQRDVRELHAKVLGALIDGGLRPASLPPAALARYKGGRLIAFDHAPVAALLRLGLTPVTFGDVILDEHMGFGIGGGDDLMLALARALKPEKALFVADVDGIYTKEPRRKGARLLETVDEAIAQTIEFETPKKDVTGGLERKLRVMRQIAGGHTETWVLNGLVTGRVGQALRGEAVRGTRVRG